MCSVKSLHSNQYILLLVLFLYAFIAAMGLPLAHKVITNPCAFFSYDGVIFY